VCPSKSFLRCAACGGDRFEGYEYD